MRLALAAVLARLSQPAEAWQVLEEDLGRGLLERRPPARTGGSHPPSEPDSAN